MNNHHKYTFKQFVYSLLLGCTVAAITAVAEYLKVYLQGMEMPAAAGAAAAVIHSFRFLK